MTLETTKPSTFSTRKPDAQALRDALGTFATGVTIVTAIMPTGEPIGFTANSFASVSLDPPLILLCFAKSAAGYAALAPRYPKPANDLATCTSNVPQLKSKLIQPMGDQS